ncbi:DUF2182 domain-containing protein [Pseudomonas sp. B35(2017)]|uniref:copper chaperone n=1 Tax=Pseudomonas sp. B35(2017) TaxID=1981722 RepID=UPI000A1F985D|nr:DUF2182 domain-containing protein [Pseudomonas sp. B35(2017)]
MALAQRLRDAGGDPLASLLWGISLSAFALMAVNDRVHAELMQLCVDGSRPVLAEGIAYLRLAGATVDAAALTGGMLTMLVAMMVPALAGPLLHLWFRSLTRHRWRAVALFLLAYFLVWLAACALLFMIALVLVSRTGAALAAASIVLAGGLLWQVSRARRRCLARCHLRPRLSVFGWPALADPLRFGAIHGFWCVCTCWALMLLPLCLPAGHLPFMLFAAIWVAHERTRPPAPQAWVAG